MSAIFILKKEPPEKTKIISHKIVFIKNEAVLLCVIMQERARAFATAISCINF